MKNYRELTKEDLPLRANDSFLMMDEARAQSFHKAFRDRASYPLPTFSAAAMKSMFQLVDDLKIDWRNVLHISQSYEYFQKLSMPVEVRVSTALIDSRLRAGQYWMNFETSIFYPHESASPLSTCRSLIAVKVAS